MKPSPARRLEILLKLTLSLSAGVGFLRRITVPTDVGTAPPSGPKDRRFVLMQL